MSYHFKELMFGPSWRIIKDGFSRRSQAEAFAIDYFASAKSQIIGRDVDAENDAIDFMTYKHGIMYQYAIEPEAAAK